MNSALHKLLSKQALILSFIKDKLEIVNFIRWGYENNLPILKNNRFLHTVSHVYYRSIILEMCTLFDDHKYQSNNFYLLVKVDKKYNKDLEAEAILLIKEKLKLASQYFIEELRDIRNEEISHFRFKETMISLNHEYLDELNNLCVLAEEIIQIAGRGVKNKTITADHAIGLSEDDLHSLQRLLQKISNIDYKSIWESERPTHR